MVLTITTVWAKSAGDKLIFSEIFWISCKLCPLETVCMQRQNLFSEKSKKNSNMSAENFTQHAKH